MRKNLIANEFYNVYDTHTHTQFKKFLSIYLK